MTMQIRRKIDRETTTAAPGPEAAENRHEVASRGGKNRRESAERRFLLHLPKIEAQIDSVCRRNALFGADADDFASSVKLRLIENDYAVIRKHRGESRLSTFLTVVIHNLLRDFRTKRWGRWRPSAKARRLGSVAVALETLVERDGYLVVEAIEMLRVNGKVEMSPASLIDLAAELPHRQRRIFEGKERLDRLMEAATAEERLVELERAVAAEGVWVALRGAVGTLATDDRQLLEMHYRDGFSIARISRELGSDQRRLYSRRQKLLRGLRKGLEAQGMRSAAVRRALEVGSDGLDRETR